MPGEILLVDDDDAFLKVVAKTLEAEGFSVETETSPRRALERVAELRPRLVVLDLVMPGMRGLEVCQRLKQQPQTSGIPILILTGNDREGQEVACLDTGADDYLTKPVKSDRLLARCRALLRRSPAASKSVLTLGELTLDHGRKRVVLAGKVHDELTPKEFELLYYLAGRPTEPQDRAVLYREIWGAEAPSEQSLKTVEVHVRRVRLKLGWDSNPWLTTVPGRGYALVPPGSR